MVAKQTEMKFKNLTQTGQYRRTRDSRWQFKRKEKLTFKSQEQKGNIVAKKTGMKLKTDNTGE